MCRCNLCVRCLKAQEAQNLAFLRLRPRAGPSVETTGKCPAQAKISDVIRTACPPGFAEDISVYITALQGQLFRCRILAPSKPLNLVEEAMLYAPMFSV